MNQAEVIEFAVKSAQEALEQKDTEINSFGVFHNKVSTTLTTEQVGYENWVEGMAAYVDECKRIGLVI